MTVSCALNSSDSGDIAKLEGRTALHEAGTRGFIDLLEVFDRNCPRNGSSHA